MMLAVSAEINIGLFDCRSARQRVMAVASSSVNLSGVGQSFDDPTDDVFVEQVRRHWA